MLITRCVHMVEKVIEFLKEKGIRASIVGELVAPKYGMVLIEDKKEKKT